jgi:hypothetical protein
MPQFDFFSFAVQIFWFFVFSSLFYLLYIKIPLNNSSQVLKMRLKLTNLRCNTKRNFVYNSLSFLFK